MLTKSDIDLIRNVVREEVETESQTTRDDLGGQLTLIKMTFQNEIDVVKDRVKNLEIRMNKNHKELKNEIKEVVNYLDKDNMKTRKRVTRIEAHLGLPA